MQVMMALSYVLLPLILVEGGTYFDEDDGEGLDLREAVLRSLLIRSRRLLDQGIPYNSVDEAGTSVMTHFPDPNRYTIKRTFVFYYMAEHKRQHQLNVQNANPCGYTPTVEEVMLAVSEERVEDLKDLLDCGAPVDTITGSTRTPLHVAVQKMNFNMTHQLLSHGANPYRLDENFREAIPDDIMVSSEPLKQICDEFYFKFLIPFIRMRICTGVMSFRDTVVNGDTLDVQVMMEMKFLRTHLQDSQSENYEEFASLMQSISNLSTIKTNVKYVIASYLKSAHKAYEGRQYNKISLEESKNSFENVVAAICDEDITALKTLMDKKAPVDPILPFQLSTFAHALGKPKQNVMLRILLAAEPNIWRIDSKSDNFITLTERQTTDDPLIKRLLGQILYKLEIVFDKIIVTVNKKHKINSKEIEIHHAKEHVHVPRDKISHTRPDNDPERYNTNIQYYQTKQREMGEYIHNNNLEKVKELLTAGIPINPVGKPRGHTLLYKAIQTKNPEKMAGLILSYAKREDDVANYRDPVENELPIQLAIKINNPSIVQLLLNKGATHDLQKMMDFAKTEKKWAASRVLRKHFDLIPLYAEVLYAAKDTATVSSVLKGLLDRRGPTNSKEDVSNKRRNKAKRGEYTPLHWAVKSGSVDKVQLLIRYGADINVHDQNGKTPMELASDEIMKNAFSLPQTTTTENPIDKIETYHNEHPSITTTTVAITPESSTDDYENLCSGVQPASSSPSVELGPDDEVIDMTNSISGNPRRRNRDSRTQI